MHSLIPHLHTIELRHIQIKSPPRFAGSPESVLPIRCLLLISCNGLPLLIFGYNSYFFLLLIFVLFWGIIQLDYDPFSDLLGIESENTVLRNSKSEKIRSWFGPNGQYIRELPCPNCRARGYTPCTKCGIDSPKSDCSSCNGKGKRTCKRCGGDCVIWEEKIDERPWEKARSRSPIKVKEDDLVDKLEIKLDAVQKSNRFYKSVPPQVRLKISQTLKSLNAKTGLFSNHMKMVHQDPVLRAQRIASIKKTKGTAEARKKASEDMKEFFINPENRIKRSLSMKGVKFYCSNCGQQGHRKFYCPILKQTKGSVNFKCSLCGKKGHNKRTCSKKT